MQPFLYMRARWIILCNYVYIPKCLLIEYSHFLTLIYEITIINTTAFSSPIFCCSSVKNDEKTLSRTICMICSISVIFISSLLISTIFIDKVSDCFQAFRLCIVIGIHDPVYAEYITATGCKIIDQLFCDIHTLLRRFVS